jgi:hypothetical protein
MCRGSGSVAVGLVTRGEPKTGLGDWRGVAAWRHSTLAEGAVVRVYDFCPSASQVLRGFVVWCSFRLACEGPLGGSCNLCNLCNRSAAVPVWETSPQRIGPLHVGDSRAPRQRRAPEALS